MLNTVKNLSKKEKLEETLNTTPNDLLDVRRQHLKWLKIVLRHQPRALQLRTVPKIIERRAATFQWSLKWAAKRTGDCQVNSQQALPPACSGSCRVYRIPPDSPDILQSSCVKMSPMKISRCKESLTTFKLSHFFFYFIVTVQCWAKPILRFLTDLHKPPRSAPLGRFPSWLYLSKNGAISVSPPL